MASTQPNAWEEPTRLRWNDPDPTFRQLLRPLLDAVRVCGQDRETLLQLDEELLIRLLRDIWQSREADWYWQRLLLGNLLQEEGATKSSVCRTTGASDTVVRHMDEWVHGDRATGGMIEVHRRLRAHNLWPLQEDPSESLPNGQEPQV